ncbi:site-specific integrase, partial [Sinorhizobium sp. 6-117]|uniref:site-specific integrase n=1 Tax=Sinorhizobium sp. 6-117 TaxID=3049090 RepID=UPI0024C399C1
MNDRSAAYVESFLEMMSAERGAATNTLQSYEHDLEDALSFLRTRGTRLADASADDLRSYLSHLAGEERDWGRVIACDRPNRILFAWQLNADFTFDP